MINFATIQFADRYSKSIKDKNLLEVDGHPLWWYNAIEASIARRSVEQSLPYRIIGNYICTNYNESELPAEGWELAEQIPARAFDTGKCLLSDRVRDAVTYLNNAKRNSIDAYILLLGNVRSVPGIVAKCMRSWWMINQWSEYTGLMTVANYSMFNPNRALSIGVGNSASLVHGKRNCWKRANEDVGVIDMNPGLWRVCEEKQSSEERSWFFDGGAMVMRSDNKVDFRFDALPEDIPTQFPFLGDAVYALKQQPMESVELDAKWQIPLLSRKKEAM